jgi:hypothetical protein
MVMACSRQLVPCAGQAADQNWIVLVRDGQADQLNLHARFPAIDITALQQQRHHGLQTPACHPARGPRGWHTRYPYVSGQKCLGERYPLLPDGFLDFKAALGWAVALAVSGPSSTAGASRVASSAPARTLRP